MWIGLCVAALATPPAWVSLSAAEEAQVQAGQAVVRTAAAGASGEIEGVVQVAAPFDAVWATLFDWEARERAVSAIEDITVYAPESDPGGLGVTYRLSILATPVVYHLRYTVSKAEGWARFALDPAKTNDIAASTGSYRIQAVPAGHRIHYRTVTDTGRALPAFVKNYVASSSIRTQLEAMRAAAQGR